MPRKHHLTMSAADVLGRVHTAYAATATDHQAQIDWGQELLANASALELMNSRITHSNAVDVDLLSRVLATRCYQLRDDYELDRPKFFFLDMFRNRGLIQPLDRGVVAYVNRVSDYQVGEVAFIGDKTVDWPTEGGRMTEANLSMVKHFGKAVEYGILELWQTARDGRDIVSERVRDAFYDIDAFIEYLLAHGAPLHGVFGFLNHPSIPQNAVAGATWLLKTPEQVITDLQIMRDSTRIASNYNEIADTAIISDSRYSFIGSAQIGTNGDSILARWLANQTASVNGGLSQIVPFVPYDTAGAASTPIATVGNFTRQNVEFPLLPAIQLPTEYHGAQWKIGFVGAASSVNVKRKGRIQTWTGI